MTSSLILPIFITSCGVLWCSLLWLSIASNMVLTSFLYHFSRSTFLSELRKILSAVLANGPKFSIYGSMPHLCRRLTFVSHSIDCNCARMNLSKARFTWIRADANVMDRNEPMSWADMTCCDKRTSIYMHQLWVNV